MKYVKERINSFSYAFKGLVELIRSEANFRIHCISAIIVIGLGLSLSLSNLQWIALVLVIGMVLIAEAFNTALELLCDRVSTEYHPLIEKAKDVAAAAVLLSVLTALAVGGLIFVPQLISFLDN